MGPRLLHRVDKRRDLAVHPAEVVRSASDTPAPETSGLASIRTLPIDASWIVLPLIAILSGLAAFVLVRSRVAATRAAAASRPATVTVDTRPAAADVFIDGRRVGAAPLVLKVQPGAHTLTLRTGDAERRVVFTAAPGEQLAQYLDLKAAEPAVQTARLAIATDPPGAQVAVDGRPRGLSPLTVENLTAAEHGVTITSSSGSIERRITLDAGATKELVFSLPRSAAVGGWLSVASPFQGELFEGGELIGTSGTTKVMLPVGRHELVLKNASVGYESRHSVDVVAGRVATIAVVAPQAPLSINAVPWADVAIDGTVIGQTPMGNVMIAVGVHEITFRHPQFGERTQAIVVTATGPNRAAVDFKR